jgi:thioredoxin-like negative regulator of GroEL
MRIRPWCLLALALLTAAARPTLAAEPAHAARPPGIEWFDGTVEDAFALAQARHRPVFLYWGAVWCPPCQELKATIFQRRDFQDRLKLFVPVYLDGDGAGAQAWGERFHISGYPTVLVLRGDRVELERVSGGMDLARYAEVLDLALGQERPVQELLGAADARAPLAADDCRRLAYNAWMLDDAWQQHPEALGGLAARLASAAQRCPAGQAVERARLQMTAVHAAVAAEAKELAAGQPPGAALQALLEPVPRLLADDRVAPAIGDTLWYQPAEFFPAAAAAYGRTPQARGDGRRALRERWVARMEALSADRRYSAADRLDALRSQLVCAKALAADGKVPAALAAAATRRIDAALAREHEPHARSSLVNSALNALEVLDDDARAHDILAGEIATSEYAYYYMADLGELEEKLGHPDRALDWLARSYHEAQGPATRFQWGVGYVRGLVRLRPQDEAAIRAAALDVLADLDAAGDLHGRTLRSLHRLEGSLRDWDHDAAHDAAIGAIRARLQPICGRMAPEDAARPACAQFLG